MIRTPTGRRAGATLLLAAVLGAASSAVRADELDLKLNEAMPKVVAQLKKKGYKNVGILRFHVKQPGKTAGYDTPLSGSLATRVENLLVIHGGPEEKEALGVIHDASKTARAGKIGAWPTAPAERRKLFALNYPLAWGNATVKPDVFLTGQVELSRDMRTTTLRLQAFDRKSGKPLALKTITVDTDKQVVRDLGYSYQLSSKTRAILLAGRASAREVDRLLLELVAPGNGDSDKGKKKYAPAPKAEPGNVGGVTVELLVDGKVRPVTRNSSANDPIAWQVASPEANKAVAFRLKNTTAKQLAVVLRLNGVSVINENKGEPENAGKIILDAKEERVIKGFVLLDEAGNKAGAEPKVRPFKVAVGDEARKARDDLGDKAGLIEVDVFEQGNDPAPLKVTLRGLPASREARARKDYAMLRKALLADARLATRKSGTREIILPDASAQSMASPDGVKIVSFDRPRVVARVAIKVK